MDDLDKFQEQARQTLQNGANLHNQTSDSSANHRIIWWSTTNAMTISACVLLFGMVALISAGYLIRHERDGLVILRVVGTVLIITLSVFLIVAGYDNTQIAPAIGLLGTLAGYLLGRESSSGNGRDLTTQKSADAEGHRTRSSPP